MMNSNLNKYIVPILVGLTLSFVGGVVTSYNAITIMKHEIAHIEDKLDKSEFYTYKASNDEKEILVIKLLRKDIELVDHKIKQINEVR